MSHKYRQKAEDSIHYPARITCLSHIKTISIINNNLCREQLDVIKDSCFGHLLDMPHLQFCGTIVHSLLLRQVHNSNVREEHGMKFLIGGQVIRFSKQEFALMTGLSFGGNPDVEYKLINSTRLVESYFRGRKTITLSSLESAFVNCPGNNDKVKLALVLFAERVLLGKRKKGHINLKFLQLVEDLEKFNKYPWGLVSYNQTMTSLTNALRGRANKYIEKKRANPDYDCEAYSLAGFPYAFQVWAFESIRMLALKYANRVKCSKHPRILHWACKNSATFTEIEDAFGCDELKVLPLIRPNKDEKQQHYLKDLLFEDKEEDKDNEGEDDYEEEDAYDTDKEGVEAEEKVGNEEPSKIGDEEYNEAATDASASQAVLTISSASNLKEVMEELNKVRKEFNGFREVRQELNDSRQEHLKGLTQLRQDHLKGLNEVKQELKGLSGKMDVSLSSFMLEFRAEFQNIAFDFKEVMEEPNEIMQELKGLREVRQELGEFRQEHLKRLSEVRQDHLKGLDIVRQELKGLSDKMNASLSSFMLDIRSKFQNMASDFKEVMEPNKIRQEVKRLREVKQGLGVLRQEHLNGLSEVRQDHLRGLNEVRQELKGLSDEMDEYLTSFMSVIRTEFQNMQTKRQRKQ